jgi:hypothetical protein
MEAETSEVANVGRECRLQQGACINDNIDGALGVERFSGQLSPS